MIMSRIHKTARSVLKRLLYGLIKIITRILYSVRKLTGSKDDGKARILVYHNIFLDPEEKRIASDNVYYSSFEKQMMFLKDAGFNVVTLNEVIRHIENDEPFSEKTVVLTFDDGYATIKEHVYPVMRQHGFIPVIFVISDCLSADICNSETSGESASRSGTVNKAQSRRFLSIKELDYLAKEGFQIASHGKSHVNLTSLDASEINVELLESKRVIQEETGCDIEHFSYPYGLIGTSEKEAKQLEDMVCKAGYLSGCSGRVGAVTRGSDKYLLNRIPVYEKDRLIDFKAKVSGAYDWVNRLQRVWAKHLPLP